MYENGRRYHSLNAGTYVIPNDEVSLCQQAGDDLCFQCANQPYLARAREVEIIAHACLILILITNRLDMVHHAVNLMFDGDLHPVKLPEKLDRILDLGTGTGIWAIDMAE